MTYLERPRGLISAVTLTAVLTASAAPAFAQMRSNEAIFEERRSKAKARFEEGAEFYRNQRYAEAVRAFLAADRLAPSAAFSFNIARAYERLDDTSGALRWYRDYLRRTPAANNAAEVQARVRSLDNTLTRRGMQQVTVLSSPLGASVSMDGHGVGVTPYTTDVPLGDHRITLNAKGYREKTVDLHLGTVNPEDVNVELERGTAADEGPAPRPADGTTSTQSAYESSAAIAPLETDRGRRFGVAPYIVAGAGVALLGGALGFELARKSEEDKAGNAVNQPDAKKHWDAMESRQTASRILAGVGGAALVTGTVLFFFNEKKERPPVAFGCFTDGCSASAQGTF